MHSTELDNEDQTVDIEGQIIAEELENNEEKQE